MALLHQPVRTLLVALAGFAFIGPSSAQAPGGGAPAVIVANAEMRDITQQVEFVGRVRAIDKVDLRARVTGFLGPRQFTEGDDVTVGQVIFRIDPAPFEAVVAQRQAQVAAVQATLHLAQMQVERGQELIRTRAIPQSTLDDRIAAAQRAQADLELAQASLREAQINLSYTTISSPIAGRIGEAAVSPGNLVGPETGVLATVVRQDPMYVSFNVTQRQLLDVRRSAGGEAPNPASVTARLRLADGSSYGENGRVDFLGVAADSRTDSIPVRAVFPNPRGVLADGMSVRIAVGPTAAERALVIPQAAIAFDQVGAYVLTVDSANKVAQRRVRAQNRRDGTSIISEGLSEGDRVIVQGQARVRPGIEVTPTPMATN